MINFYISYEKVINGSTKVYSHLKLKQIDLIAFGIFIFEVTLLYKGISQESVSNTLRINENLIQNKWDIQI